MPSMPASKKAIKAKALAPWWDQRPRSLLLCASIESTCGLRHQIANAGRDRSGAHQAADQFHRTGQVTAADIGRMDHDDRYGIPVPQSETRAQTRAHTAQEGETPPIP